MYVIASLSSDAIEGTLSEPQFGESSVVNGKYYIPSPAGVGIEVDSASYLSPQDANSVPGLIASQFLERNPNYDHVIWNYFLASGDIALLDLTPGAPSPTGGNVSTGVAPTLAQGPFGPRCQVGRGAGPGPTGVAPNSIKVLPQNANAGTPTYGALITDTVDLTPYTGASGSDEVLIWWKLATPGVTEDIVQGYNLTAGLNRPVRKTLTETTQEPAGFRVYASVDDGVSWHEARYMDPTDLLVAGTDLRVAFVNEGNAPVYLLGFMVLVADAP
jgi:hypothetical protein